MTQTVCDNAKNVSEMAQRTHSSSQTHIIVVVEALFDHVKLPVLSRVISDPSAVQPVAIVAADIMVNLLEEKF